MLLADGSRGSRRSGSESKFNRKDRKRKEKENSGKKDSLLFAATTTTNKEDDHHGVFLFGAADPDPDTIIDQISRFKY